MKLINLTQHVIRLVLGPSDDNVLVLPGTKETGREEARVAEVVVRMTRSAEGVAIDEFKLGRVQGLPDPEPGTVYIVSGMVVNALVLQGIQRPDVVSPATGRDAIRRDGQVWAVRGFRRQL